MRELRDFYNPNMTASINGHEYEVPAPSARDGLRPVSYTHLTLPTICSV